LLIQAGLAQQLGMSAALDYPSVLNDQDLGSALDGREAMGDGDDCTSMYQRFKGCLDALLRL
jgi:hypothetical protein